MRASRRGARRRNLITMLFTSPLNIHLLPCTLDSQPLIKLESEPRPCCFHIVINDKTKNGHHIFSPTNCYLDRIQPCKRSNNLKDTQVSKFARSAVPEKETSRSQKFELESSWNWSIGLLHAFQSRGAASPKCIIKCIPSLDHPSKTYRILPFPRIPSFNPRPRIDTLPSI